MIKQYLDYKRVEIDNILASSDISNDKKERAVSEYNQFINKALRPDFAGKVILDKAMAAEMMGLVKSKKIPLLIDASDREILLDPDMPNASIDNQFQSSADILAVHKSPILPVKDKIVTQENNGVTKNMVFVDPSTKQTHVVPFAVGNDTTHFTLNCAVENHSVGNDWDTYNYATIINLSKLNKEKILDTKGEDTYVDGDAELGDDYFLICPLGEREKAQTANPGATVIEYGEVTLNEAISYMIIFSEKKLQPYGTYGWGRNTEFSPILPDEKNLESMLKKEEYPILKGQFGSLLHSESKYMSRRMWKREYEAIISLIEYNREQGINMPSEVMQLILMSGGAYGLPGSVPVSIELYKEYVNPILEKHGYHVGKDFFEGISSEKGDIKYISHYNEPSLGGALMPSVACPDWENTLRTRAINLISQYNKHNADGNNSKGTFK